MLPDRWAAFGWNVQNRPICSLCFGALCCCLSGLGKGKEESRFSPTDDLGSKRGALSCISWLAIPTISPFPHFSLTGQGRESSAPWLLSTCCFSVPVNNDMFCHVPNMAPRLGVQSGKCDLLPPYLEAHRYWLLLSAWMGWWLAGHESDWAAFLPSSNESLDEGSRALIGDWKCCATGLCSSRG